MTENIKIIFFLVTFLLCACNTVSVSHGKSKVIIKPHQRPCTLESKKVDPNCKISDINTKQQPI